MIEALADIAGGAVAGIVLVAAVWTVASGPGRRMRQRRHEAWTRKIRYTYGRGGESARGET